MELVSLLTSQTLYTSIYLYNICYTRIFSMCIRFCSNTSAVSNKKISITDMSEAFINKQVQKSNKRNEMFRIEIRFSRSLVRTNFLTTFSPKLKLWVEKETESSIDFDV